MTSDDGVLLTAAPIVEAVVDIDCDMPPRADMDALDAAAKIALVGNYPTARRRLGSEHEVSAEPEKPLAVTIRGGLLALQYFSKDEKQIVQLRPAGYSFNRLAPYETLDAYLDEIERTWKLFVELAHPVIGRRVRLRYINRLLLPIKGGRLELDDFLRLGPRLPDKERLIFTGFFNQHSVAEPMTGNSANIIFATQPRQVDGLPVILDIEALKTESFDPADWSSLSGKIASLRSLKNRIFENSLTEKCLNLYRH